MSQLRLFPNAPFLLLAVVLPAALAQDAATTPKTPVKAPAETMVVLGSATPVPLTESQRSVDILPVQGQSLAAESPQDFLREDSSIFLEERGAGGGQADIVMRGGSFEQTLVLLNGFRINDAQTSHHNLDLPLPMDAINSIQSLEGAGSTLHGVDALSGVVDFLTAAPDHDSLFLRAGEGSFQSNEQTLVGGATRGSWSGRVAAERNFSTGFTADPGYTADCTSQQLYRDCQNDRDYRNMDASAESWSATRLGITDLLVASSDRSFGANQFYGPYNSWERTKGWFAGARQELGSHTVAAFGYRRHTDDFALFRNDPAIYENNHIDGSWQGSLRQHAHGAQGFRSPDGTGGRRRQHSAATTFQAACARLRSAFMRAIAARATWTSIYARQRALEPFGRRARRDFFRRRADGVFAGAGGQFAVAKQFEAARQRRVRVPDSYLHRSLLFRSFDARQSEAEAGVGLVERCGRGLGAVAEAHAVRNRILLAATRHHRLREEATRSQSVSSRFGCPAEHLVRGQPKRLWFFRR